MSVYNNYHPQNESNESNERRGYTPNSSASLKDTTKSKIDPLYIKWGICLLIGYFIVASMFAPEYGDASPFLLILSAFFIDAFVIKILKEKDILEVFILIGSCTFVAILFYAVSIDEETGSALFIAMLFTFINLIISYLGVLAVRRYERNNN
ncbi:hypothetical protein SAMN05428981_1012 [Bacillus sp. OV194]|nr:hypothetical protein SAMN05428981_1012 [Bacillus sp. OV194]